MGREETNQVKVAQLLAEHLSTFSAEILFRWRHFWNPQPFRNVLNSNLTAEEVGEDRVKVDRLAALNCSKGELSPGSDPLDSLL